MQPHVNSYYAATRNHTGDFPVLEELVECWAIPRPRAVHGSVKLAASGLRHAGGC